MVVLAVAAVLVNPVRQVDISPIAFVTLYVVAVLVEVVVVPIEPVRKCQSVVMPIVS
jgi:hypothetical protein